MDLFIFSNREMKPKSWRFYALCLSCLHITHTCRGLFPWLSILIYLRTKSKVNNPSQIPAVPRSTPYNYRKGDLFRRENCLYSVNPCIPAPLKISNQIHLPQP